MARKGARPVYMIGGGITRFVKRRPEEDFRWMVREAFENALADVPELTREQIDGSVCSYFSDHFAGQLMAGAMVQDYLGLCPKPSRRVEGGGATGGLCFQAAWEAVASGRMEVCAGYGFETMSRVSTWKGNELIALASDASFDFPLGGFYTGYYAMMVTRHMHEFGTTERQLALVSVKAHDNAAHNPYAQKRNPVTVDQVLASPYVAHPLKMLDICAMSDGAACVILASEEAAQRFSNRPVRVSGVGCGTDTMRMADRPHGRVPLFPWESEAEYAGLDFPGVHSCRAGRVAALEAYAMAGISDPIRDLSLVELHDAFTSSEIQTYEDLGLCKYGEGGTFIEAGHSTRTGKMPVNPSGGLLACGHPIGATGLMQAVFAYWQLQNRIGERLGNDTLQIPNARRAAVHSHAGTGTYVTVSILEVA
ncbi:MAG: thiolase C-terminal domain-containing protein [Armatimonadota bacterium]